MSHAKSSDPESPLAILIADDSEDFRSLLKVFLKPVPCIVTEAADGEEAVELFGRHQYDLIIMDIIMPLMDGVDAIAAIRTVETKRRNGRTPIIALSGEDSVETGVDCLQAGADRMLLKPVSRAGLVQTVCGLLNISLPD